MRYFKISNPIKYQELFYQENGLQYDGTCNQVKSWRRNDGSYIHTFGSMDKIQCGVGNYSTSSSFFVEYHYTTTYLHIGIIYHGTTYSVIDQKLVKTYTPSSFLAIEKACGGVNCWKSGENFKGVELSIEFNYVQNILLPFLGCDKDALDFLSINMRYLHLPVEMTNLLRKLEGHIMTNTITEPLQRSIALELISYLLHPSHQYLFNYQTHHFSKDITIGARKIRLTSEDVQTIMQIHNKIHENATQFHTIYELSQEYQISEQKLKTGFREIYQISLWDYANEVRMNLAVRLLSESSLSVLDVSQEIGYQSQAAFINMFKKWCGITPGQFRIQMNHTKS